MQRAGEEARRERGQKAENRHRDRGAERRGEEPPACTRRHRHVLWPVARSRRRPNTSLGGSQKRAPRQQQRGSEHQERHAQRVAGPLREHAGDQCAEAETTEVGSRRDDLCAPVVGAVQLRQPRGCGGGDGADAQAAQHTGEQESRQRGPNEERDRGNDLQRERRHQHAPAPVPVRDMPGDEQAERDRDRIDGERDRDRQRREAIALCVQRPQRRRDRRERHRHCERDRHDPKPDTVRRCCCSGWCNHAFQDDRTFDLNQRKQVLMVIAV